ncbi:MAG: autotransporter-associated beta strand repeat-containing protein, partial [Akkermansiaceae bacterium]|nr:autotransporter-associated beta strand repeat-containing protein [Verrucomicrobiales bacterium]
VRGATALGSLSDILSLRNFSTLQLRSDSNATFNATNILLESTSNTLDFDVNNVTAGVTGKTLTLPGTLAFGHNSDQTINVTGGNNYTLALGDITATASDHSPYKDITINAAPGVSVVLDSFTAGNWGNYLNLQGGGQVRITGNLGNTSDGSVLLFVNGGTTATLQGPTVKSGTATSDAYSYFVQNGTLVLDHSNALINNSSGTGIKKSWFVLGTTTNTVANNTNSAVYLGDTNYATGGIIIPAHLTNHVADGGAAFPNTGTFIIGGQNTSGVNTYSNQIILGYTTNRGKSVTLVSATGGRVDFKGSIQKNGTDTTAGLTINDDDHAGMITLAAANTYAGSTIVNAGMLSLAHSNALGSSTSVTVNSKTGGSELAGTRLELTNGVTIPNTVSLSLTSNATGSIRSALYGRGSGTNTWNGPILLKGTNGFTHILADVGSTLVVNGSISNSLFGQFLSFRGIGWTGGSGVINGKITLSSANGHVQFHDNTTWTINSTNNTWWGTEIAQATVRIGQNNALPTNAVLMIGTGGTGRLDLAGFTQQVAGLLDSANGYSKIIGNSSTTSDSTLRYVTGSDDYVGVIVDSIDGGTRKVALTVVSGALTFSSSNTYSGATTISGGTLSLGASNVISDSSAIILGGGTLNGGGYTDTFGALTIQANSALKLGSGTSGTLTFASGTYTGGTLTISNWTGTAGLPGTADRIFITAAPSGTFLSNITFNGYSSGAIRLGTGEIVPAGVTAPTQLAITSVNGGASPRINTAFSVVVQVWDAGGSPVNVTTNTAVILSVNTGSGGLAGTLTGTVTVGNSSVTINGVTYNQAESGVILTATRTSGHTLTPGNSSPFTVTAANGNWNVNASGNWSTAANWTSNPLVPGLGAGDIVGLNYNITAARTVTMDTTSRIVGTLNIGDPGSSYFGYTLTNSGGAGLTFDNIGSSASLVQLTTTAADILALPITLADDLSVSNNSTLTISGPISGTKGLTKSGTGTLTLSGNNSYRGDTLVNEGMLQLPAGGVINGGAASVTMLTGAQLIVSGGSLIATNSSNIGSGSQGLLVSSGSASFAAGLTTTMGSSSGYFIHVTGGSLLADSLEMGRTAAISSQPAEGLNTDGLYINGGNVTITNDLEMGVHNLANSSVSTRIDSGSLTVGGVLTVGLNNGNRWSILDVNGGTLTVNDTATGVSVGGPRNGNALLQVRAGTATVGKISLGQAVVGSTNMTAIVNLTGGSLYVGIGGMWQVSAGANFVSMI